MEWGPHPVRPRRAARDLLTSCAHFRPPCPTSPHLEPLPHSTPTPPPLATPVPHGHERAAPSGSALAKLALGALGVVYGDIGTSPLYALQECFSGTHSRRADPRQRARRPLARVLGDDLRRDVQVPVVRHARRQPRRGRHPRADGARRAGTGRAAGRAAPSSSLGLFGAALLYGDGVITPAISVLGAVEGVSVAAPALDHLVVPAAVGDPGAALPLPEAGHGDGRARCSAR